MYGNTVKDGSGNAWWILVDSEGRLIVSSGDWDTSLQADVLDNDSDKTFTVPAATKWEVVSISVKLATSADVGNRQLRVIFTDASDNVIADIRAGAVQAASVTRNYFMASGMPDLTSFRDTDLLTTPLPQGIVLTAGYKVRIYDKAAVAAAADDMHVQMVVKTRAA